MPLGLQESIEIRVCVLSHTKGDPEKRDGKNKKTFLKNEHASKHQCFQTSRNEVDCIDFHCMWGKYVHFAIRIG